jgi:hypothetical protein
MARAVILSAILTFPFLGAALDAAAVVRLYSIGFEIPSPRTIIAVGDINGDGSPDFVVEGQSTSGSAALSAIDGRHGRVIWNVATPPTYLVPRGPGLASIGDVNGDGRSDIALGQPYRTIATPTGSLAYAGGVEVRSGATGMLLFGIDGSQAQGFFGQTIAALGDISNDGVPDFVACGPGTPNSAQTGATPSCDAVSGLTGALLYRISGAFARSGLGTDLAALGDVNGDGRKDFIVAGVNSTAALPQDGFVQIRSGVSGAVLATRTGATNQLFGQLTESLGDLNGDGREEIFVGDRSLYTNVGQGFLLSVQNSPGGALSLIGNIVVPGGVTSVTSATATADYNGDGVRDIVIGFSRQSFNDAPRPQIVSGATGQLLAAVQPGGTNGSDSFGATIATIGDVTGDGKAEIAIGGRGSASYGETAVYSLTDSANIRFGCGSGPQNTIAVIGQPTRGSTVTIRAQIPQAANSHGLIVAGVKGFDFAGVDFNLSPHQCRSGSDPSRMGFNYVQTDAQGVFSLPLTIPNDASITGLEVYIEAWAIQSNSSNVQSTEARVFEIL